MAFASGTATSAADLFDKLIEFLTTDADLVAAGEEWAVAWDTPGPGVNASDIVLRGPGLSESDTVYVGLRLFQNAIADVYYIETVGMTGVLPSGNNYKEHINVTPTEVRTFLSAGTMGYWFVASGRRFIAVVKISTVYEALYAGLFMPYATPLSYPYPLFIGGSAGAVDNDGPVDWRSENVGHSHFMFPYYNSSPSQGGQPPSTWLIDPAGQWQMVANEVTERVHTGPISSRGTYWFSTEGDTNAYQAEFLRARLTDGFGAVRALLRCTLLQADPDQTFGVLDGAFYCQGHANAVENTITIDGVAHLVVQNTFHTAIDSYWALALE